MLRFLTRSTGDMHIGNLRVAILNYIVSRQRQEELIVKIDDTDKDKNIEGKDKEILEILELFGIEYSQVINQSQNFRFHSAMALQLLHDKKAFSCFCSSGWLENKKEEAKASKKAYRYDDACANLPAELVIDNTNPFTIRINKPTSDFSVKDYINGDITVKAGDMDSFVIMNQDKTPTFNFACAIDDMLNDISIVICDEDNIGDIAKQDYIRSVLKYDKKIEYANLPNILDDNYSVKSLLEDGFLPSAILNYLISIGNEVPKKIFTLEESIEWFSFENISKTPASFNLNELREINNEHLKMLDSKELSRYVGFADEEIGQLAKIYLAEVSTTKELKAKIEPIFANKVIPQEFKEQVNALKAIIKEAPYFDKYDEFKSHVKKESGFNDEKFAQTLQILLTGSENTLDVAELYKYLKNYIKEIVK